MSTIIKHYAAKGGAEDVMSMNLKDVRMWEEEFTGELCRSGEYKREKLLEIENCRDEGEDTTELEQELADIIAQRLNETRNLEICEVRIAQLIAERDANNYSLEKLRFTFADGAIYEMSVNQWMNWNTYFGVGTVSAAAVCSKGHTYILHIKQHEFQFRIN